MNKLMFLMGLIFIIGCHDIDSTEELETEVSDNTAPEFESGQGQSLNTETAAIHECPESWTECAIGTSYCAGSCCDPGEDPLECLSTADSYCCKQGQFCIPNK